MRLFTLLLAIAATPAGAAPLAQDNLPGLYFSYGDWELACDNTGTCRAAGYQVEQGSAPLSLLLTRKAGPGQPVRAQLQLGDAADERARARPRAPLTLALRLDGKAAGSVRAGDAPAEVPAATLAALLAALPHSVAIDWSAGAERWRLSDQGAAAVLLKMDEYQGRIGTRGALVKPGDASEQQVPKATPAPVIQAVRWTRTVPGKTLLAENQAEPLRKALRASLGQRDYCPELLDGDEEPLSVRRLDARRLLVSTRCATGAYNISDGYWVIDDSPAFHPQLVTTSGSEAEEPYITESHKGRGIGDCRSSATWTWDGERFVHSAASSTGMCRMVAAGGAWDLPRLVSEVRAPR
jgi:hypothetical protein